MRSTIRRDTPTMKPVADVSRLEADVLREVDALLLELKGRRAVAAVEPDASLEKDLGLGSLERVELLSRLEKRFHARVSETVLGEAETPRDLATAFLRSEQTAVVESETTVYRPSRLPPPKEAS